MKNKQLAEAMIIILNVATVSTGTDGNKQGPWRHFECGWANTSDAFEKKNVKGPLFSKFSKSGWAMAHLAHPPTRALATS